MKELLKQVINNYLLQMQGCKITELVCQVAALFYNKKYNQFIDIKDNSQLLELLSFISSTQKFDELLNNTIDEMIEHNEITVVKYVLPNMKYREKTYLFPKNTDITEVITSQHTIRISLN